MDLLLRLFVKPVAHSYCAVCSAGLAKASHCASLRTPLLASCNGRDDEVLVPAQIQVQVKFLRDRMRDVFDLVRMGLIAAALRDITGNGRFVWRRYGALVRRVLVPVQVCPSRLPPFGPWASWHLASIVSAGSSDGERVINASPIHCHPPISTAGRDKESAHRDTCVNAGIAVSHWTGGAFDGSFSLSTVKAPSPVR
jgi:hypothetical protein